MQLQIDKLGKVAITVEQSYWSNEKDYDRLTIVEAPKGEYKTYISRKPVPAGTVLTNREYWIPFSNLKEEIVIDFNEFVASLTEAMQQTKDYADNTIEQGVEDITAIKEEAMRIITYIADNGIDSTVLAPNSITSEKIKARNVLSEHIGEREVKSINIGEGEVKSINIDNNAVTTSKLQDYDPNSEEPTGIPPEKIANGAITGPKLAPGAITNDKIDPALWEYWEEHVDAVPTAGSVLPVQSGGVKGALDTKLDKEAFRYFKQEVPDKFIIKDIVGNIVMQIDSAGIKGKKLLICDSEGNVLKTLDATVLDVNDIEDSLTSQSAEKALSAKQGHILGNRVVIIEGKVDDIDNLLPYFGNSKDDEFVIQDSDGNQAFKIDYDGIVHLNKVLGHGNGLFAIKDAAGFYAFKISEDGETDLVISEKSFVGAFNKYLKSDLELMLPPYLFTAANYCYSDNPLSGRNGTPSKRNYAPVVYLDKLVSLGSDGFPPDVTFLGGNTSMRIANTSPGNGTSGANFDGTSVMRTITNRVVGERYNDYNISVPLYVAKNTNLLTKEQTLGRKLNMLCFGDSETDHGEWSSYIRKLVLMDNVDYKKKTSSQTDVMDIHLVGTRRDVNNEEFTYRGETVTTPTGNYNEGRGSWACYTYLRHAKLYTWSSVTYNSVSKSVLHCAWRELGLFASEGREYAGTNADKMLIGSTCSGANTLAVTDLDGWVWNNNRSRIGLSSVEWDSATAQDKQDMIDYLNTTLLNAPDNPFYSKDMVTETDGDYAFSWDAYYARYKNRDIDGSVLEEQGTSVITDSFVCVPDYVLLNLGTNDTAAFPGTDLCETRMSLVNKLAHIIHSQIGCPVIVFTPSFTSRLYMSGAEACYAEAQRKEMSPFEVSRLNTAAMKSLFGNLADQEEDGVYFCPTYWTQRFGTWSSSSYVDIGEDNTEIGTIINSNEVHPSVAAYDDWGYMLYSMLNYILR